MGVPAGCRAVATGRLRRVPPSAAPTGNRESVALADERRGDGHTVGEQFPEVTIHELGCAEDVRDPDTVVEERTGGKVERDALEGILSGCFSTAMIVDTFGRAAEATPVPTTSAEGGALQLYDDNGNGRISCAEARQHGIAPVSPAHPAYEYMDDRDGDGVVCE